jgi:hypothetical protein
MNTKVCSGLELYHQIKVFRNKNNKSKNNDFDTGIVKSNSFCIAFLKHIERISTGGLDVVPWGQGQKITTICRNTSGNNVWIAARMPTKGVREPCIQQTWDNTHLILRPTQQNIVVGTNATPHTLEDFRLAAIIPNGFNAGQLQYSESKIIPTVVNTATTPDCLEFGHTRLMINDTIDESPITIAEMGLYTSQIITPYGANVGNRHSFLLARDIISPTITLNHFDILEITYLYRAYM